MLACCGIDAAGPTKARDSRVSLRTMFGGVESGATGDSTPLLEAAGSGGGGCGAFTDTGHTDEVQSSTKILER